LLKNEIGFRGLALSDAMWMGKYGHMENEELMPVYLNSFLSGLDLLMIPGSKFKIAVNYFRKVYDKKLTQDEISQLEFKMQKPMSEIYEQFYERIDESIKVQRQVRAQMEYPDAYIQAEVPKELTISLQNRYNNMFSEMESDLYKK
ncbi:MAG: hypothetical protein KDD45_11725, partial [Bdellovibrionales bacterium]|nr:hypothetical protein [Bdellovibrionales bacterium]